MPDNLHPIEASELHARRERVFLILAGLFLGSMTMLNILGISRFIKLYELIYPLADGGHLENYFRSCNWACCRTPSHFLCTDFVSEFYGRRRANWLVMTGLLLNVWCCSFLWLGGLLPGAFEDPVAAAQKQLPFFKSATWLSEPSPLR